MQHDEFLEEVQQRARLDSRKEATEATEVVLETLAERLPADEAEDIASELPKELAGHFEDSGKAETFGVDEFFQRINGREEAEGAAAKLHAQVVTNVLATAISEGELDQVFDDLPPEYRDLLGDVDPDRGAI